MADYYTLLTNAGLAYEAACKANGVPIKLSKYSVGDGNGSVYNPDATVTGLRREVWRGDINALLQDANNPSWLIAELTLPDSVGGWYIREAGIWTDSGILYAIVKYPESYKPVLAATGAGKEFYIRAIFQTSNAANVALMVDETIVKATRAWVTDYVANELAKLDFKRSVRAVATGPITLSNAQKLDTVAVIAGDRVLVPFQANAAENGLYTVANGPWLRVSDADVTAEVTPNLIVSVEEGEAYADSIWHLTTNAPITLGVTALSFELVVGKQATREEAVAGLNASKTMTPLRVAQAVQSQAIGRLLRTTVYSRVNGNQVVSVDGAAPTSVGATSFVRHPLARSFIAELVGGGGGSGGTSSTTSQQWSATGGGSGGVYGRCIYPSPETPLAVTVGQGGNAGAVAGPGGFGGSSSIGTLVSVGGGGYSSQVGPITGNGIVGGSATSFAVTGANLLSINGGYGTYAIGLMNFISGTGGGTALGPCTAPRLGTGPGVSGLSPGVGAAGACTEPSSAGQPGAKGGDGLIIIYEYA